MVLSGRTAVAAIVTASLWASPAVADDFCVGAEAGCVATLELALQAARDHPGPDRVLLAKGEHEVPAGDADAPGEPVTVAGTGPVTSLTGEPLSLAEPGSRVSSLAAGELVLAGIGDHLMGTGPVRLLAGARLSDSVIGATVTAVAPARVERSVLSADKAAAIVADGGDGTLVVEDAEIASAWLDVRCATVSARHLTITGAAPQVADVACAEPDRAASLDLRDSVVHGDFPDVARVTGEASATSAYSLHAEDADVTATDRLTAADPGFVSATDLRPAAGSPLLDAGEPLPLSPGEGFWDLGSLVRVADGDGDGAVRRDVGAHERQPAPTPVPAGNVLLNPGAEEGAAAWTRTGSFTDLAYGAEENLLTREAGEALGGGGAYFSAGADETAKLVQRIDVSASAREIDTGLASAGLAGLLGGYGADADEVRVTAVFRDPEGGALASLGLGPVTAAERGNATNLLPRSAAGGIPERTRAIDVEIAGTRVGSAAETYTDAYADNLSLVLSVPGIPVPGPVDPGNPPVKNLRPFSGVTVLTGRPRLSSTGRAKVRVACASATVGRCTGSLELRAQLRRGQAFSRIAQFARFAVSPGRATTVTVKLTLAARRALRRSHSFRATLRAVARDGQGLERKTTIPIRVVRR
jgi:hypothetical protein